MLAFINHRDPRPVYNLSVEGSPEYFAAGVLMHNCDATRYLVRGLSQAGTVTNALQYMLGSNPKCSACERRFAWPLGQPSARCPHCGAENTR